MSDIGELKARRGYGDSYDQLVIEREINDMLEAQVKHKDAVIEDIRNAIKMPYQPNLLIGKIDTILEKTEGE